MKYIIILAALVAISCSSELSNSYCTINSTRCQADTIEVCSKNNTWEFYRDCERDGMFCAESQCHEYDGDIDSENIEESENSEQTEEIDGDYYTMPQGCKVDTNCRPSEVCAKHIGATIDDMGECQLLCVENSTCNPIHNFLFSTLRNGDCSNVPCETDKDCEGLHVCDTNGNNTSKYMCSIGYKGCIRI